MGSNAKAEGGAVREQVPHHEMCADADGQYMSTYVNHVTTLFQQINISCTVVFGVMHSEGGGSSCGVNCLVKLRYIKGLNADQVSSRASVLGCST